MSGGGLVQQMLKIQYASSLFISRNIGKSIPHIKPVAPVLALTGNIGNPACRVTQQFLKKCANDFEYVLWIPGFEELMANYSAVGSSNIMWKNKVQAMKNISKKIAPNIAVLSDEYFTYPAVNNSISNIQLSASITTLATNKCVHFYGSPLFGPCFFGVPTDIHNMYTTPKQIETWNMISSSAIHSFLSHQFIQNKSVVMLTHTIPSIECTSKNDREHYQWIGMVNSLEHRNCKPVSGWIAGNSFSAVNRVSMYGSLYGTNPYRKWNGELVSGFYPGMFMEVPMK